jgi:hypothetical protein
VVLFSPRRTENNTLGYATTNSFDIRFNIRYHVLSADDTYPYILSTGRGLLNKLTNTLNLRNGKLNVRQRLHVSLPTVLTQGFLISLEHGIHKMKRMARNWSTYLPTLLSIYGSTALCWTFAAFQFLDLLHSR